MNRAFFRMCVVPIVVIWMAGLTSVSSAALVKVTFTGYIDFGSANHDTTNLLGFGAGPGVMDNSDITGVFYYDTAAAPAADAFYLPDTGYYETLFGNIPVLTPPPARWITPVSDVSITKTGFTTANVPVPGLPDTPANTVDSSRQRITVDTTAKEIEFVDNLDLYAPNSQTHYDLELFLGGGAPGTLDSVAIPTSLDLADFATPTGQLNMSQSTPDGTVISNIQAVFGITSLTFESVPEPATLGLLSIGTLALLRRRR